MLDHMRHARIVAAAIASASERGEIPTDLILSANRSRSVSQTRQLAMWLAHQEGVPLAAIGRAMNRDHTTVMHGVAAVEKRMKKHAEGETR